MGKKIKMKEAFEKWKEAIFTAENYASIIGERICKALRPIIPDLTYSVGWAEAGVETLCFYSNRPTQGRQMFHDLFRELPIDTEYTVYFDAPFGIYLTKKELEKAKEILLKLWEE